MKITTSRRALLLVLLPIVALAVTSASADAQVQHTCEGRIATIIGTEGDDVLTGTSKRDVIVGLGGDDVIRGLDGADTICGGPGRDRILGGKKADIINGGDDGDKLFGDAGHDVLRGGRGNDLLVGGLGDDDLDGERGRRDRLRGRAGYDTCGDPQANTSMDPYCNQELIVVGEPTCVDVGDSARCSGLLRARFAKTSWLYINTQCVDQTVSIGGLERFVRPGELLAIDHERCPAGTERLEISLLEAQERPQVFTGESQFFPRTTMHTVMPLDRALVHFEEFGPDTFHGNGKWLFDFSVTNVTDQPGRVDIFAIWKDPDGVRLDMTQWFTFDHVEPLEVVGHGQRAPDSHPDARLEFLSVSWSPSQ